MNINLFNLVIDLALDSEISFNAAGKLEVAHSQYVRSDLKSILERIILRGHVIVEGSLV